MCSERRAEKTSLTCPPKKLSVLKQTGRLQTGCHRAVVQQQKMSHHRQ